MSFIGRVIYVIYWILLITYGAGLLYLIVRNRLGLH